MSKVWDIKWISISVRVNQVLCVVSYFKNYIYIYWVKLGFVAIPIGAQAQEVNVTPNYIFCARAPLGIRRVIS